MKKVVQFLAEAWEAKVMVENNSLTKTGFISKEELSVPSRGQAKSVF